MRYSKIIHYAPLALAVLAALAYLGLYLLNLVYSPPGAGANTAPSGTYHLKQMRNWTLLRPRKPRRLGVVEAPSEG